MAVLAIFSFLFMLAFALVFDFSLSILTVWSVSSLLRAAFGFAKLTFDQIMFVSLALTILAARFNSKITFTKS